MPRVAVAVRAGDVVLGSIWAAVHEPLSDDRMQALRDAARLVALHMLRIRAGEDVERRLRADLLSTALEGGVGAREALSRLGLADQPVVVLALALPSRTVPTTAIGAETGLATERQRLGDAFAMHLSAVHPRCAAALVGDVAYGLVPVTRARRARASSGPCGSRRTSSTASASAPPRSSASGRWPQDAGRPGRRPGQRRPGAARAAHRPRPRRAGWPAWPMCTSSRCCWSCATWSRRAVTARPGRPPGCTPTTRSTTPTWSRRCGRGSTRSATSPRPRRPCSCTPTRSATGCAGWPRSADIDLDDSDARFAAMLQLRLFPPLPARSRRAHRNSPADQGVRPVCRSPEHARAPY